MGNKLHVLLTLVSMQAAVMQLNSAFYIETTAYEHEADYFQLHYMERHLLMRLVASRRLMA